MSVANLALQVVESDNAEECNPYTSELPGADELESQRREFLKQFGRPDGAKTDYIESTCQSIIDEVYGLLSQYSKLGFLLRTDLNANEDRNDLELYKLTDRKCLYNEEALEAARALAKSMDLRLNGIQEVDASGQPVQDIPKVSDLKLASFFKHMQPATEDFLLCIEDAANTSYRSKYIVDGSFVQSIAAPGTEPAKLAPHLTDSAFPEVSVRI